MALDNDWMNQRPRTAVDLHIDRPHPARIYDVVLGGKTNYPPDREAAAKAAKALPTIVTAAWENRYFVHRAARFLAHSGTRQFLDIGTGIPTSPNLHEVVQEITPEARVAYADNDPIVLAHSRALHIGTAEGRTAYVHADVSDPESILRSPELAEMFDFDQPIALTMCLLLHWLPRSTDTHAIVAKLTGALAPGSHLVVTHLTDDFDQAAIGRVERDLEDAGSGVVARSRAEVTRYFDGLELLPPGVVVPQHWRPDAEQPSSAGDTDVPLYAGVARKTG